MQPMPAPKLSVHAIELNPGWLLRKSLHQTQVT